MKRTILKLITILLILILFTSCTEDHFWIEVSRPTPFDRTRVLRIRGMTYEENKELREEWAEEIGVSSDNYNFYFKFSADTKLKDLKNQLIFITRDKETIVTIPAYEPNSKSPCGDYMIKDEKNINDIHFLRIRFPVSGDTTPEYTYENWTRYDDRDICD